MNVVIGIKVRMPRGWKRATKPADIGEATLCPYCDFLGTTDDYDVMGLPEGQAQCLECGRLVVPVDVVEITEPMPLFDGRVA